MSLEIIEQQPTKLHLYANNLWWSLFLWLFPCTIYGVWLSYTSGRVIYLECLRNRQPTPCQVTIWHRTIPKYDTRPTIASIESAHMDAEEYDGGTIYRLMLKTPNQTIKFPGLDKDAIQRATPAINTFSQQVHQKPFKLNYSNHNSSNGWTIFWILFTSSLILGLLYTPISVDLRFDTETGWLSVNYRYIFWRHQHQTPLCEIQSIDWIEKVRQDDSGDTTTYKIDLITRSSSPISILPSVLVEDTSRADSKAVVIAIIQILNLPMSLTGPRKIP